MANALLSSLSSALNLSARQEISRILAEPEPAVSKGLELASSALFAGLNRQSGQPEIMRRVIDMASKAPADLSSALNSGQLVNPNSPLLLEGKNFLASVLGARQDATLSAVARDSGLRATSAATVLALAAQSVMSFIGTRVREDGTTASGLAALLQGQAATAGKTSVSPPLETAGTTPTVTTRRVEIDPVVAQVVEKEKQRSIWGWLLPLLLILLGLLFWFMFRGKTAAPVAEAPAPVQSAVPAVPAAPQVPDLGSFVPRRLPDGTTLNVPERGVEGRLLAFIEDPAQKPDKTSWFDFDRLLFNTGSATLQPQSLEQLHNIAAILKAYWHTHLTIGGYTDNTGDAAQNLKLSQARANNVAAELVKLGIAKDRLVARGYGQEHPVGDNATEAGRRTAASRCWLRRSETDPEAAMADVHKDGFNATVESNPLDPAPEASRQTVIPLFEEQLAVTKQVVPTARVQVARVTHSHEQLVDELLSREQVEIERIAIGKPVDTMPAVREEGDCIIIPVVEEVLKIERVLVLKEEVRLRRVQHTERYQERVTLRKQEAVVKRLPIDQ